MDPKCEKKIYKGEKKPNGKSESPTRGIRILTIRKKEHLSPHDTPKSRKSATRKKRTREKQKGGGEREFGFAGKMCGESLGECAWEEGNHSETRSAIQYHIGSSH